MTTMAVSPSNVFDIWAQVDDKQPNPILELEQRFLKRMLPDVAGLDVLDAGCGAGRWLQFLASCRPASLVGVDSSPEMLQRASAKVGTASTLLLGSCVALPIQNATADLVLASFVLSYLHGVEAFARELHRVTRSGATIFLTDIHPDAAIGSDWKWPFKANGIEENLHTSNYSLQQIIDTFRSCGFELLTLIEPSFDSCEKTTFQQNGERNRAEPAGVHLRSLAPLAAQV